MTNEHELFSDQDFPERPLPPSVREVEATAGDAADATELFLAMSRRLQRDLPIARAMLVVREAGGSRYVLTVMLSEKGERRNLSLRLPTQSSLIEKVAEDGNAYTDNCAALFDGNPYEKNLLISDDTEAIMLLPIKHEGLVVGVIGFSSDAADAFVTWESTSLLPLATRLGEAIVGGIGRGQIPRDVNN